MGWDDGPQMDGTRDAPESGTAGRARGRGGVIPPIFWVLFILVDVVILGAVLIFVLAR
jgi:hypothetical protein